MADKFLAKTDPPVTVDQHGRLTGEIARELYSAHPVLGVPSVELQILAALHDVGKISPSFLSLIAGEGSNNGPRHELISAAALAPLSADAAAIVGAHHGAPVNPPRDDRVERFGGLAYHQHRKAHIEAMIATFGPIPAEIAPAFQGAAAGFVTVADWIASGAPFAPAAEAVRAAGFEPVRIRCGLSFRDLFDFEPNSLQSAAISTPAGRQVYVINAGTGSGKTESALALAYRELEAGRTPSGLYFAMPTTATANAMISRIGRFVECIAGRGARLVHSSAAALPEAGGELAPGGAWFRPAKRSLLYPFAVGTIDQALYAALRVRHYTVRQYALAGKVLIIDELHSFDAYTGTLAEILIKQAVAMGGRWSFARQRFPRPPASG